MITVKAPWRAVPQYAMVVLPQGVRYVVDPRGITAVVVLFDPIDRRYAISYVDPSGEVAILLPELPDALRFLSTQFTLEEISGGDNP